MATTTTLGLLLLVILALVMVASLGRIADAAERRAGPFGALMAFFVSVLIVAALLACIVYLGWRS